MDAGETTADACPECHAVNPWIYENDEYNCRHCGHVRVGDHGAKFRDEGEYVQPLTEIYFKNPVFRDGVTDRPLSAHLQKVEASLEAYSHSPYTTNSACSPTSIDKSSAASVIHSIYRRASLNGHGTSSESCGKSSPNSRSLNQSRTSPCRSPYSLEGKRVIRCRIWRLL